MTFTTKLLPVIAAGVLTLSLAACGGDEEEPASTSAAPAVTAESPTATETAEPPATTTEEDPTAGLTDEQIEDAIAQCKEQVAGVPTISDDTRAELEQLCDEAATADPSEAQENAREVCRKIVEDSVPEGTTRETALEACDTAG